MLRVMRKPCESESRCYPDRMINLNEYFSVLPGAKARDKIDEIKWNENILNIMANMWSKQACKQGFYCESITSKNM